MRGRSKRARSSLNCLAQHGLLCLAAKRQLKVFKKEEHNEPLFLKKCQKQEKIKMLFWIFKRKARNSLKKGGRFQSVFDDLERGERRTADCK